MTEALNAHIKSFATFEEIAGGTTVKTVVKSVVAIPILIRVGFSPQFLPIYSLTNNRTRASRQRRARS